MSSERETIIQWGPYDRSIAAVWTNEPAVWRRLERAGYEADRVTKVVGGRITGKFFTINRRMVLLRSRVPAKRLRPDQKPPKRKIGSKTALQ